MKKSSRVLSLVLAVLMAASCFTGLTIFSAAAAEDTKIYFELPSEEILPEWGVTKNVFCHFYSVYGDDDLFTPAWKAKSEKCKFDADKGLYYFDTTSLCDKAIGADGKESAGDKRGEGAIREGCDYALIFATTDSAGEGHQTCNVTFSKECLGGTVYCTGGKVENTEDSSKLDDKATWKEPELAANYGPRKAITSTGAVVGEFPGKYQPIEQLISQFIFNWAVVNVDRVTPELTQKDCELLGVDPMDAYNRYAADYAEQLSDPETYPTCAPLSRVAELLGVDPEATTEEPTTEEPTTEEPTTEEPTTEEPTTEEPTTEEPTTEEPTTEEPTTEEPTTEEPTTEEPTTVEPTTEPTTEEPTTEEPTTEPTPATVCMVAGVESFCNGYNWVGDPQAAPENVMVDNGDNTYSLVFPNTAVGTEYQIKVVEIAEETNWYGLDDGSNVTFAVTAPCDVTVTFNAETKEVSVTGENVNIVTSIIIDTMVAVGNGDGNWLNGVNWDPADLANEMTMISEGVYQIRYEDIDEYDSYELKFAANGSWANNWGGVFAGFGVDTPAEYNSQSNIVVVTEGMELCDLIITIDLTNFDYSSKQGAVFSIVAIDKTEEPDPTTEEPTTEEPTTEEPTTEEPTTEEPTTEEPTTEPAITEIFGDADGDGEITIIDATEIQKLVVGLTELTPDLAVICDVDGDGRVAINDVTLIQMYIANRDYYSTGKVGLSVD